MQKEANSNHSKVSSAHDHINSQGTEKDLAMPESRSLLPESHNEVFGVNTSSFVMTNEDI